MKRTATVLGAGAVGVCVALQLQREGFHVRLVDENEPGSGCSFGNAGLIQCGAVVPVATPSVLRSVPKMLLDPDQPLVVRWRHLPTLAPYLLRFLIEAAPARVEANARALASIVPGAYEAWRPLIAEAGLQPMVRRSGELYIYESEASLRGARAGHALRRAHGVEVAELSPGEARELEPALTAAFHGAAFVPDSHQTTDPFALVSALAGHFRARGGEFLRMRVEEITPGPADGMELRGQGAMLSSERLVLALGAFSGRFARRLGDRIILDSERGYHLMLPAPGVPIGRTILSGDYRFAIAPIAGGVRLAGTAELARIGAPANPARARRLLPLARRLFPGLSEEGSRSWMGHRPSTPDSLPVIDRARRHPNLYYAFGHGHLGLTLAAATGAMIADLMLGRTPAVSPAPFGIRRFHS